MRPQELATRRWFRAKQRPIAAVNEVDAVPIPEGGALVVVEVAYADGGTSDRYLLPTLDGGEPSDGDGVWRRLLRAVADGRELRGSHGAFDCAATDALEALLPDASGAAATLTERRLQVEQSNTSVVLGDRLILKLFRLLEPGESPDLEISAFLTDAGFSDTPALAGAVTWRPDDGAPAAAAMLQAYVPSHGDAWAAMLGALATDPASGVSMAAEVGRLTARMHAALASRPMNPAFPARPATGEETALWRASAERQLAQAVTAVSGERHERLVAIAPAIRARFADTFGAASGEATVSRIHGDYHLGQLLVRDTGGFSVIDFEGEPARPLEERRLPASPLRDVAGLLRSLDYAARTAEAGPHVPGFDPEAWLAGARAAFLGAYGALGTEDASLLEAFELEKACYEVRYEANNRPSWLWLPLAAVERLIGAR
jgi:trehalose synthase-fused probable maltokinase